MMTSSFQHDRGRLERPTFSSHITSDRLRESERRSSSTNSTSKIQPQRRSVFREEGLDDLNTSVYHAPEPTSILEQDRGSGEDSKYGRVTFDAMLKDTPKEDSFETKKKERSAIWLPKLTKGSRPMIKTSASAPPGGFPTLSRSALIIILIALVLPGSQYLGKGKVNVVGADATPTMMVRDPVGLETRQNSQTDVCTRWAHQSANVNGTVYIYGGNSKDTSGQVADTWNNDFLTLDLTKTWKISSPSFSGLPKPSGPPAVAMGSLWNSYDSLWLFGGYFSDNPKTSPLPMSTWKYDIKAASWEEFADPKTSAGNFSDGGGKPVQRAAEGAGLSIPEIGRAYYFGGHLDEYTTPGWSNQIWRLYLRSFLEFTFPGYANTGVQSLGINKAAPKEGVYRNITEGGIQDDAGFTERADSALVYIPGWGTEGIILGLGGGTNETFTSMNIIDVYDVANSVWYKQATTGEAPRFRVNPCSVVAAASDASSFNVYLYGGQNLLPYGSQTQYSDMWVLSVPSFTWIKVQLDGQSQPPARAGHTCVLWDAQMVVIGGYVGKEISCDSPGVYVFDASTLKWKNDFTSLSSGDPKSSSSSSSSSSGSKLSGGSDSPESDQYQGSAIMRSSFGYQVPEQVIAIIGGSAQGGATATTPASGPATAGPIATGKPPTFTVTQSGSVVTQTATAAPNPNSPAEPVKKSSNVGAIAAGTVAGAFALLAAYLAFCTWLYRRQLNQYKDHVARAQRTGFTASPEPPASWSGSNDGRSAEARMSEKPAGAAMLGPFGTHITNITSRSSESRTPQSGLSRPSAEDNGGQVYGGGSMPPGIVGRANYADEENVPAYGRPSGSTAHSSTEDLLSGLEPSFFNVVMNPRRTLRVVNSDSD